MSDVEVLNTKTAFWATGAEVIIDIVVVAGAVEVVTTADVVVSKQSKLLHGQPAGHFD